MSTTEDEMTDFEKMIETQAQLAEIVSSYRKSLIESGVPEDSALVLTIEFQKEIISAAVKK
jgi:hypothetical protein